MGVVDVVVAIDAVVRAMSPACWVVSHGPRERRIGYYQLHAYGHSFCENWVVSNSFRDHIWLSQ